MNEINIWERYEQNAGRPFSEAAQKYLDEFDGKDIERQKFCLQALLPYIKDISVMDVNNDALAQYKEDRLLGRGFKKPVMVGTLNKELTLVTTILTRACRDWEWIPRVPRIRHVKGDEKQAYTLTWDEQDALFSFLPESWRKGAAKFLVNTGVRKGEMLNLRWRDKQDIPGLDTFVFVLRDTKNGKSRAVICNSLAREAVEYQDGMDSEYVFPGQYCYRTMGDAWVRAGLPKDPLIRKGVHNFRHTFGHRLRSFNVPAEDRNLLLGHANSNLSEHYADGDLERLSEMAERVTERKDFVILR